MLLSLSPPPLLLFLVEEVVAVEVLAEEGAIQVPEAAKYLKKAGQ
jgi:hypothetical protein